jgi:hypothetical protein
MTIKSTLLTMNLSLILAGIACLVTLPAQAGIFRNVTDKYEDPIRQSQQNQQADDNRSKRSGRLTADSEKDKENQRKKNQTPAKVQPSKPARGGLRREQPRRDQNNERYRTPSWNRERDKERNKKREEHRPIVVPPPQPLRQHPPPRVEKDRHERPPTTIFVPAKRPPKPVAKVKRPRHHITYPDHIRREYHYTRGPWYYDRYISPLPYHFHPIGYRITVLPSASIRIVYRGLPYFYYTGVFYRPYSSGYIVVSAPIGAFVSSLPDGFIAFSLGIATYYYVNDTYYLWDPYRSGYMVVEKPKGADEAIEKATSERLVVYPNKGQDEEQQAKDRYECHRWAVTEAGFDPTLEEEEFSASDRDVYRRALAACLEGRDYTVK